MMISPDLSKELLRSIPNLRAFAISLSGNSDKADDLVQETILKAWMNINSFTPGTNLNAWLFTILRNLHYSNYRKYKQEIPDIDGEFSSNLVSLPDQEDHVDFLNLKNALNKLPHDQREAIILIGASGFSYEEAARICGCAVGTLKSRVNRARAKLAQLLSLDENKTKSNTLWRSTG